MRRFKMFACVLIASAIVPLSARSNSESDETDALWLARLCVHEATWAGGLPDVNDCGGILQVLRNRVGNRPFDRAIRSIARRFYDGTSARPWARALQVEMRRSPPGWPATWPPFGAFARRWQAVYERSLAFVRGELDPPCVGTPRHWLSRTDPRDRAVARRYVAELHQWREVDCGTTRNAFYELVPR